MRISADPNAWLAAFAEAGCYLDDFSSVRGDRPHTRSTARDVREAVQRLARLVSEKQPTAVVPVLREIENLARDAVAASTRSEDPSSRSALPLLQGRAGEGTIRRRTRGSDP